MFRRKSKLTQQNSKSACISRQSLGRVSIFHPPPVFPMRLTRNLTTLYSHPFFLLRPLSSLNPFLCAPHSLLPPYRSRDYCSLSSWDRPSVTAMPSYSGCARINCTQWLTFLGKAMAGAMNLCEAICSRSVLL